MGARSGFAMRGTRGRVGREWTYVNRPAMMVVGGFLAALGVMGNFGVVGWIGFERATQRAGCLKVNVEI